jgi:V8-like Glu-specific endopeptidase
MPERPLTAAQVTRRLKPRPALKKAQFRLNFELPTSPPEPGVRVFPPAVPGTLAERPDRAIRAQETARLLSAYKTKTLTGSRLRELNASVAERLVGVHSLEVAGLEGYLPEHLPLNPRKPVMDKALQRPAFHNSLAKLKKGQHLATTIFAPDDRYVFSDTAFPWCTTGKVDTGGGWGSGALVGPRHLLCASHMMTWNSDNTVNQVTFTPSYFDGNAPFGNSGIIHWYAYRKNVGPTLSNDDVAEDYVVLVLTQRLGDICGWMGTRGYDSGWNGLSVWSHIGYPGDLTGGSRPTYQGSIPIDSTSGSSADEDLWHKGDVWPGQSGGPYFAWFGSEPWPRACGVQSGQNSSTNSAGGGYYISNLVNTARTDFP